MSPNRRTYAVAVVALVLAGVGGVALLGPGRNPPVDEKAPVAPATAAVTRMDMSETRQMSGELGYGPVRSVISRAEGIVTQLPMRGRVLGRGDIAFRVDDKPVVVLFGRTPLFRSLGNAPASDVGLQEQALAPSETSTEPQASVPSVADAPLQGPDVEVLRTNLVALGVPYATVGTEMTSGTVAAIKAWQESMGMQVTGSIDPTTVLVLPGPARVDAVVATVGDDATQAHVLDLTSTTKQVSVQLDAGDRTVRLHTAVDVTLPTGRTVAGRVRTVSRDAVASEGSDQAGGSSSAHFALSVSLEPAADVKIETGPCIVLVPGKVHRGVLAVPVTALLALQEGGYAVQVVTETGSELVGVTTGMFGDGMVEISGAGLKAGQIVEVAS